MTWETVEFSAAIRGFHVHGNTWQPQENQILLCSHETENPYDLFAIKTYVNDAQEGEQRVGHLPLELSRITKFLLDRGAIVNAIISGTHYRRSVLVQGGLEIPCTVKAKINGTEKNKCILSKYLQLAHEMYAKPTPEQQIVVGHFLTIGDQGESSTSTSVKSTLGTAIAIAGNKSHKPGKRTSHDIRSMLKKARENSKNTFSVADNSGKDGDDGNRISID